VSERIKRLVRPAAYLVMFAWVYWGILLSHQLMTAIYVQRAEYCCMIRPWHVHMVGDIRHLELNQSKGVDGWSGVMFSVTDRNLSEEELGRTLAHENRHIAHALLGGAFYAILYSKSDRFHSWAESDCRQAEVKPLRCGSL